MIHSAQQAAAYARGEVTEGFVEHPAVMDERGQSVPSLAELRRKCALELAVEVRHPGRDADDVVATARLFEKYLDQG